MKYVAKQVAALVRLSFLDLYRRKDIIAVAVLGAVILVPLMVMKPFGVDGAGRYVNEIALLLIWLFSTCLALGLSARQMPPEFDARTIYPLLAKPVSRGVVLLGKYLGAFAASASALLLFYLAYAFFCGVRQGVWFPPEFVQAVLLHISFVAIICAVALTGSLLVTPSANLTLSGIMLFGMLFFGQKIPDLIASQPAPQRAILHTINWLAPHAECFDMRQRLVHGWGMIDWSVCMLVLGYAILYVAVCLAVACVVFRRRSV